ncbi:F-box/LRR-repeat protein At4g14103-like [Bidens hawaiensis]|uniref:F-box/LRR-repeat protein At4g14103-like n=1 Tax=Bidens hawaiensis TaxID=980011 RepID=UPI00404B911F
MSDIGQTRYMIQDTGDNANADDINRLPDCIIHHILSFIPTKDVVKTAILSKTWNNVWTSVSNLDFDDALLYANETDNRDPPEETCFIDFVERVLLLRGASNINKFRLSCRVFFNAPCIHSWISSAIAHNVENLDLCLFVDDPFVLPGSLFCSQTLTNLKVEMNCALEFPSFIHFPCLKTLHLSLVTFTNDGSTQKLFSGCPVLEELTLVDCEWLNIKNITISSPTLKWLTIDDLPYFGPPDEPKDCKIKIYASNLEYFKYTGYPSNDIIVCDVSSLVKAYISVPVPHEKQKEVGSHVVNLLKGLSKVVFLNVSDHTIESLVFAGNMVVNLPVFKNLTCLEMTMEIRKSTVEALMKFINMCPNLQCLYISEGLNHDVCDVENDLIWSSLPKCISSCLKMLTFKNINGNDSEICFLKCILHHASVLEKMDILCCESLYGDPNRMKAFKTVLQTVSKGSKSCVVTFS